MSISTGEAVQMVETIINLKREKIITDTEARLAIEKIDYFKDVIKTA